MRFVLRVRPVVRGVSPLALTRGRRQVRSVGDAQHGRSKLRKRFVSMIAMARMKCTCIKSALGKIIINYTSKSRFLTKTRIDLVLKFVAEVTYWNAMVILTIYASCLDS